MFLRRRPTDEQIRDFIATQKDEPLTFLGAQESLPAPVVPEAECPEAGKDARVPNFHVRGYLTDHNCVELGRGQTTFQRAIEAINRWEMFNIDWLQLCWPDAPIETGSVVAVLAYHLGFWSLNACKVISVINECEERCRYGFIYGTLPDHAERGQEQFTVEWRRDDNSVLYEILAYSRPNLMLARLGYPITRLLQRRFARDSMKAMLTALGNRK